MKDSQAQSPSGTPAAFPGMNRGSLPTFMAGGPMEGSPNMLSGPSFSNRLGKGRRTSRFDPMGGDDDLLDEDMAYGELGVKHPLRRVHEESITEEGGPLPGIKALFGVADHPSSGSSSSGLFQTPSLPSLTSPSSSPSTRRTSRYSSLGSSVSASSEPLPGWWAPDFDRSSLSSPNSLLLPGPGPHRHHSFPFRPAFLDEHDSKRRRSDQPKIHRDPEEEARMLWRAQSRNASLPSPSSSLTGSISGPSGSSGLRSLLHPPRASSSAMSRGSISVSPGFSSPLIAPLEHPMESGSNSRRPSVSSRSASVVGGQLAQSFADLSAADRISPYPEDRRGSVIFPPTAPPSLDRSTLPSALRESFSLSPATSRAGSAIPQGPLKAHTRPPSPEPADSTAGVPRRSSLTELIMAKSGDDIAIATGRFSTPKAMAGGIALEKPSLSEPGNLWSSRRESGGSDVSHTPGKPANYRTSGHLAWNSSRENLRLPQIDAPQGGEEVREDVSGSSNAAGFTGMDVLAASAQRVADEERAHVSLDSPEDLDGEKTPGRDLNGAGPKYACAYCSKTFSRPSSLRIHTYSHTGERPYVCKEPTCRRRFSVQSNLKRHAKVHQLQATSSSGSSTPQSNTSGYPQGGQQMMHGAYPQAGHPGRHAMHPPPGPSPGYSHPGYYQHDPRQSGGYHGHYAGHEYPRGIGTGHGNIHGGRDDWEDEEEDMEEEMEDEEA